MARFPSSAAVLILSASMASADSAPPSLLRLALRSTGAAMAIGTSGRGSALPLPLGGAIDLALGACEGAVCEITGAQHLGPLGDLIAPIPLTVANVPICLGVRPDRVIGRTDLASGAIDVAIPSTVGVDITTMATVCPSCEAGTCDGGALAGAPCAPEADAAVGSRTLHLSRDCPPAPSAAEIAAPFTFTTATLEDGPICPTPLDAGSGAHAVPEPAWPDKSLPKRAEVALVAGACAGGTDILTVDLLYGLPGPMTLRVPASATWADAGDEPAPALTLTVVRHRPRVDCRLRDVAGDRDARCEAIGIATRGEGQPLRATRVSRCRFGRRLHTASRLRLTPAARTLLRTEGRLDVTVYGRVRTGVSAAAPMTAIGRVTLTR